MKTAQKCLVCCLMIVCLVLPISFWGCAKTSKADKALASQFKFEKVTLGHVEGYKISGILTDQEEVVIPATYKKLPVLVIGEGAFKNVESLKKVTIGRNINRIEKEAFKNAIHLNTVIFESDSVLNYIGAEAFQLVDFVGELRLPISLREIGDNAFSNSTRLRVVVIPAAAQLKPTAFKFCTGIETIELLSGTIDDLYEMIALLEAADTISTIKDKISIVVDPAWAEDVRVTVERAGFQMA